MTEALATLFEGKEVRVIERDGEPWFPISDLAKAWGINRKTPANLIDRNREIFEGMAHVGVCNIPDGEVNERGLYLLMGKISADRLKNPEARAAIIRFQRWVPELIQKYRKREIVQAPAAPVLETELSRAKQIAELTGTDLKTMQAAALRKCGLKEYADALTPSLMHGQAGTWLNPTDIGNRCGHSAHEINNFLSFHRFQYRDQSGVWRLTDKGELHGEEYWFESSTRHREVRIRWRDSILTASGLIREQRETLAKV
jgi:prophage antirepressor-like protein